VRQEIRAYALVIGEKIVSNWVPMVWEAFLDYRHHAMQLSRIEAEIVGALAGNSPSWTLELAERGGLLMAGKSGGLASNRERTELETRSLTPPWKLQEGVASVSRKVLIHAWRMGATICLLAIRRESSICLLPILSVIRGPIKTARSAIASKEGQWPNWTNTDHDEIAYSLQVFEKNGGDDETRTRDLCRDRIAL
jgi:hypothetical protein